MEKEMGAIHNAYPILVVDDEPMVLSVLDKMLEKLGYAVETAQGSQEAILRLTGSAYRLVITDFNMPTLNGLQLAGWIKQHHPLTKVVIMTGCSTLEMSRLTSGGEIDALLFKPIGLRELRDLISQLDLSSALSRGPLSPPVSLMAETTSLSSAPLSRTNPALTVSPVGVNEK
jgi:DNA-binding NtrC family response regulator